MLDQYFLFERRSNGLKKRRALICSLLLWRIPKAFCCQQCTFNFLAFRRKSLGENASHWKHEAKENEDCKQVHTKTLLVNFQWETRKRKRISAKYRITICNARQSRHVIDCYLHSVFSNAISLQVAGFGAADQSVLQEFLRDSRRALSRWIIPILLTSPCVLLIRHVN